MNPRVISSTVGLASLLVFADALCAQAPRLDFPAPSPTATLKQRVGLTDIEINYSRPSAKGRKIFGDVVPFGQVWRTGANATTKVSFSTPVKLEGVDVPAGKYALLTIPGESEWTVILSKDTKGSPFDYDAKNDLARIKVTPVMLSDTSLETLTIEINRIRDESALLELVWEKTVIPLHLQLDVASKLLPQIKEVMDGPGGQKPYFQAAVYYYEHDQDLKKAKEWIEAAAKERDAHYIVYWKAKILAKLGEKDDAIAAAKHSIELAEKAKDSAYVKMNKDLLATLQ